MTQNKEKFWTIPNTLSISRIPLSLVLVILLLYNKFTLAIITLAIIGLTDFFDGYTARKLNQTTKTGEMLDQIADKIAVLTIIMILVAELKLPLYVLLILTRDLIVVIFAALIYLTKKVRGLIIKPSIYGKIVTALQFITLILIIIQPETTLPLVLIILIMTIITLIDYSTKFVKLLKEL